MSRLPAFVLSLAAAMVLTAPPVDAGKPAYKWTDENGVVHYSDQPPPADRASERVVLRSGRVSESQEGSEVDADPSGANAPGTPARDAQGCAPARRNLEVFEKNARVRMDLDGDGTPEELTPEQHAEELERTRGLVGLLCKGESED